MRTILMKKSRVVLLGLTLLTSFSIAQAQTNVAAMRDNVPLNEEVSPPAVAKVENRDLKRMRDYPQQPPTIPHTIDKYQVDKNFNKCMDCHARENASEVQATPVGLSHYLNREDEYLGGMSPRRYFCTQCHVTQTESKPLVENVFVDVNDLIKNDVNK